MSSRRADTFPDPGADPPTVAGAPPLFTSGADRDGDFDGAVPDPRVAADTWQAWRAEVAFADRLARHNGHAGLLRERIDGRLGQ